MSAGETEPSGGLHRADAPDETTEPKSRRRRLKRFAANVDTQPSLLTAADALRRRLPGDDRFGDSLSTAGSHPAEVVARGVSAFQPGRRSVAQELGLAGLQVWQSLSEATGRGRGDQELAVLFTDLVGFSAWALRAGDAATIELLRAVGTAGGCGFGPSREDRQAAGRRDHGHLPGGASRGRRRTRRPVRGGRARSRRSHPAHAPPGFTGGVPARSAATTSGRTSTLLLGSAPPPRATRCSSRRRSWLASRRRICEPAGPSACALTALPGTCTWCRSPEPRSADCRPSSTRRTAGVRGQCATSCPVQVFLQRWPSRPVKRAPC
jgi:hypothetical protein